MVRPGLRLLDLPPELIGLIASNISNSDLVWNVQRTCMSLRHQLKNPASRFYGTVSIVARDTSREPTQTSIQLLSRWLACRAPGIQQLNINQDHWTSCHVNLLSWLLGRHDDVQFGLHTEGPGETLAATWSNSSMIPKLGRQLVSLELKDTAELWPVLFQLQALTRLHLSLIADTAADSSAVQLQAKCQLPRLEILELVCCSASVSPLLGGISLPSLKSLLIGDWKAPGNINIAEMESLTALERLTLASCDLTQAALVLPMRCLKQLTVSDVGNVDWQLLLKGATRLSTLKVSGSLEYIPTILKAIDTLPSLTHFCADFERTPESFFLIGRIQNKLSKQGGTVAFGRFEIEI